MTMPNTSVKTETGVVTTSMTMTGTGTTGMMSALGISASFVAAREPLRGARMAGMETAMATMEMAVGTVVGVTATTAMGGMEDVNTHLPSRRFALGARVGLLWVLVLALWGEEDRLLHPPERWLASWRPKCTFRARVARLGS